MLLKSFKTKLNPNNKQSTLFAKHADADRYAWNWGLDTCFEEEFRSGAGVSGAPVRIQEQSRSFRSSGQNAISGGSESPT